MVLTFDIRLRSDTAEPHVKFQGNPMTITIILATSRFGEIWEVRSLSFSEMEWWSGPQLPITGH